MKKLVTYVGLLILTLSACSQKPEEIHLNSDQCAHCKMMITEPQFASQAVSDKGKAFKFDAVECLLEFYKSEPEKLQDAKLWVRNYEYPGEWLDATQAVYVVSDEIQSPMGASLLALSDLKAAEEHIMEVPGRILDWQQLQKTDLMMRSPMSSTDMKSKGS